MAVFKGVGAALVTLFDDDGEVDATATAAHAATLVAAGIEAVVVCGSTGEAAALTPDERLTLIDAAREAVEGRAVVIAGTGAPSARQAVELTTAAVDRGVDAVLTLSPPGANDVRPYYDAVAKAAGATPVLGYHFPAVAPPGIPVSVLADLPIAGCKDSTGDADRLLEELTQWSGSLYVGSASVVSFAALLGATGAILALANVEPERCLRAFAGDAAAQLELVPAHTAARGRFPAGIKELVASRYGTSTVSRMG
jgi:4-hydroxy-tetrahydrodipicolinate synthase